MASFLGIQKSYRLLHYLQIVVIQFFHFVSSVYLFMRSKIAVKNIFCQPILYWNWK